MATDRRRFLGGLLATGVMPVPTWADAGAPAFLSAGARSDGTYVLCGISRGLDILFQLPLPDRGHAAAAHPSRPEAVAFARRPGTFAVVIDCATGMRTAILQTPRGRHFYGHGVFSQDGAWLFTTENDYDAGRGCVGVWDVRAGYLRAGEWDSGGIGPHDIKRLPGSDTLVVANGGIDTHPDTGRTKLNIPVMRPNLTYLEDGAVVAQASLPAAQHKNSIRHLAVSASGKVAFGMQWQGEGPAATLVGTHQRGGAVTLFDLRTDQRGAMQGYIGSIAYGKDETTIAVSSPRGGSMQFYDAQGGGLLRAIALEDVCGVAPQGAGFVVTAGTGDMQKLHPAGATARTRHALKWDNHLVAV